MRILFVCSGNTCRSPMAQAILQNFPEAEKFSISCNSAGIYANGYSQICDNALQALKENFRIENFHHTSQPLTAELIEIYDLIICMSFGHKCIVQNIFGEYEKIISMPEDIPDPYGMDAKSYSECSLMIAKGIDELIKKGIIHG